MCKNIYIEEISGNFDGFDYNLNADIENDGAVEVSAFINHSHISFNDMINDFKTMLNCLKSYFDSKLLIQKAKTMRLILARMKV